MSDRAAILRGLAVAAVLAACCAGCAPPKSPVPLTSAQAVNAFDALYPGFVAVSAVDTGTAWTVSGYGTTHLTGQDATVAVQAVVSPDATGPAVGVVDGRRWAGTADLEALLASRAGFDGTPSSVIDTVWLALAESGARVIDVRRLADGRVSVSAETTEGVWPPLVVSWDSDTEQWRAAGGRTEPSPVPPTLPARFPPRRSEVAAVLVQLGSSGSSVGKVRLLSGPRIAKDSRGRWWAAGIVGATGQEEQLVYIVGDHGRWRLWDSGSGVDRSELPVDVRNKLGDW
jgi:hypothetical protein